MSEEQRPGRRAAPAATIRTSAVWESVLAVATARQAELGRGLRVLDLGGGTGGVAVPLAERGHAVIVVDPSPDALASLLRRADEVGVAERVTAVQGDAGSLAGIAGGPADLLCCHGVLEVVDDPGATVAAAAAVLAEGGVLSLVVAQRLAAVLSRALAGRFAQAQHALTSPDGRWGETDPLPRRFDAEEIHGYLRGAGLEAVEAHGVRVVTDLVPAALLDSEADRTALLDLERHITQHPSYAFLSHLGAALHVLARPAGAAALDAELDTGAEAREARF